MTETVWKYVRAVSNGYQGRLTVGSTTRNLLETVLLLVLQLVRFLGPIRYGISYVSHSAYPSSDSASDFNMATH